MIISASRRTDIPAFYSEWFVNRLKQQYLYVRNPFNANQISKINLSPDVIDCIVFWTKDPTKIIDKLNLINELGYKYYFQFTITSYDNTLERNVPPKEYIINTFQSLSNLLGPEKIIWRYDPILLTNNYSIEYHKEYFECIAEKLSKFTHKCTISFIDLYKKCEVNLKGLIINEINSNQKRHLAYNLSKIAGKYNIIMESCAEALSLRNYGVSAGKCIDDQLISKIIGCQLSVEKDKSQRHTCGCIASVDIGAYNTCKHGCRYCYANFDQKSVTRNFAKHDIRSPILLGNVSGKEKITERKMISLIQKQDLLF